MKQKKRSYFVILGILLLAIVAFGYKFYYCDVVTEYLQVTYYPRMVKLYSITWGYGAEYNDPKIKISFKSYETDSVAFSTEYRMAKEYYSSLREFGEEDFLNFVNDNMNPNSPHYAEAMFYYEELQKEMGQ